MTVCRCVLSDRTMKRKLAKSGSSRPVYKMYRNARLPIEPLSPSPHWPQQQNTITTWFLVFICFFLSKQQIFPFFFIFSYFLMCPIRLAFLASVLNKWSRLADRFHNFNQKSISIIRLIVRRPNKFAKTYISTSALPDVFIINSIIISSLNNSPLFNYHSAKLQC